jgi:hypothetical protein
MRCRRIAVPLAVTCVVGYLAVMVISGEQPTQRQFVEFEAKGVLKSPPEHVRRVELVKTDQHGGSDDAQFRPCPRNPR